ncbi:DUF1570 domain-containing protein [Rubripirellula amarantea]|uniref:DUF1570 domain-containing protein n=1 Tax=Rubripirellula amarantea TaxID=2527999 RepID=A0A5C5WEF7_9BACT|nr:DUF1570 domain-containing protein [Rubripirellula amarantea]MDA8745346.1 DUF1570 domain-containing protein [Rubripirellula amarantea]TWT49208.1 hypothetical protein Pla22_44000 [Rubripirellula amarantea]
MNVFRLTILIATLAIGIAHDCASTNGQAPAFVEFLDSGRITRGLKLLDVPGETLILGRDGAMHSINSRDPRHQIQVLNEPYSPIPVPELRNQLRDEYGRGFEVHSTKNFLIVQPEGRGDQWPKLFEESHRSFCDYVSKRGVKIREGRFPMVAVVMPDEQAMYREFKKWDINMSRVAGVYSGKNNRVITHDGGSSDFVKATVRHEAAHQSAFNSGVHSRLCDTPKWISEGLGQMFEPAGMTNRRRGAQTSDRINLDSLTFLKRTYPHRNDEDFAADVMQLFSDDTMFEHPKRVSNAYAVSWAVMFYLAEREPQNFARIINVTSSRQPFTDYPRTQRLRDVEEAVDSNILELSKRVSWFVHSL